MVHINTTQEALSVFPNPATTQLFFNTSIDNLSDGKIMIYTTKGELMIEQSLGLKTNSIDIIALPKDVYILQLTKDQMLLNQRFVKL